MDKRTDRLIDMIFDDIPYSPEVNEAQEKISSALDEKYRELCKDRTEGEAIDEVLAGYGSLPELAKLAGYTEEQAKAWRDAGDAAELKPTKKLFWKQRRQSYLQSLLLSLT